MDKNKRISIIKKEVENLEQSPLYQYREKNGYKLVIGSGDLDAEILFIGEAPGRNEAETGKPFVGQAGKLLNEFLTNAKIKRDEVYITNIVKDRPPNNRRPTKEEVKLYAPFLVEQIMIIKPKIVVTLGKTSTDFAFEYFNVGREFSSFSEVEGEIFQCGFDKISFQLYPLYHPAYAIYNRSVKPMLLDQFEKIPTLI